MDVHEMDDDFVTQRQGRRRKKMANPRLNRERDLPLLSLICDSVVISRPQIEDLLDDVAIENYGNRNRRLKRLAQFGQLDINSPHFPYLGRVFSATQLGLETLQMTGRAIPDLQQSPQHPTTPFHVAHFLRLNEIRAALRRTVELRRWIGPRQIEQPNQSIDKRSASGFDCIAEIAISGQRSFETHLGIKSEIGANSVEILSRIDVRVDRHLDRGLLFVETTSIAQAVPTMLAAGNVMLGVIALGEFRERGVQTTVYVHLANSIQRIPFSIFVSFDERTEEAQVPQRLGMG